MELRGYKLKAIGLNRDENIALAALTKEGYEDLEIFMSGDQAIKLMDYFGEEMIVSFADSGPMDAVVYPLWPHG